MISVLHLSTIPYYVADPQIVGSYYCGGRFSKCSLGTIIFESLVITSLIIALAFAHVKAEACPKEEYSHAEDVSSQSRLFYFMCHMVSITCVTWCQ